jgi:hypothetical protein
MMNGMIAKFSRKPEDIKYNSMEILVYLK